MNESFCLQSDPFPDNLKFLIQLSYLLPGIALHIRILQIILFLQQKIYMKQSFFIIFSLDSMASLSQLSLDAFQIRPALYIPQICNEYSQFLNNFNLLAHFQLVIYNYMRAGKSVIQVFLTLNRMTCVVFSLRYAQLWRHYLPLIILIISLSPFLVIWNLIISEVYVVSMFSGFSLTYRKRVSWASLSTFQMLFMILSILITITCTPVTIWKMSKLKNRLRNSEKSLCWASIAISMGFLSAFLCQLYFATSSITSIQATTIYFLQYLTFDMLNIGGPVIMILFNRKIRMDVFGRFWKNSQNVRNSIVVSTSSSTFV